jgi:hypothetical protein
MLEENLDFGRGRDWRLHLPVYRAGGKYSVNTTSFRVEIHQLNVAVDFMAYSIYLGDKSFEKRICLWI